MLLPLTSRPSERQRPFRYFADGPTPSLPFQPSHPLHPRQQLQVPMPFRIDSLESVDDQNNSPFFALILAEIRTVIFEFALTQEPRHCPLRYNFYLQDDHAKLDDEHVLIPPVEDGQDNGLLPAVHIPRAFFLFDVVFDHGRDCLRPDYFGQQRLTTALLRTCQRIYIENYKLPLQTTIKVSSSWDKPCFGLKSPRWYIFEQLPVAARQILHLHE